MAIEVHRKVDSPVADAGTADPATANYLNSWCAGTGRRSLPYDVPCFLSIAAGTTSAALATTPMLAPPSVTVTGTDGYTYTFVAPSDTCAKYQAALSGAVADCTFIPPSGARLIHVIPASMCPEVMSLTQPPASSTEAGGNVANLPNMFGA
jgi:hypothetical protein